ncbi:MAG: sulfotransferase [Cyanobacteria bacterium J06560_6]
MINNFVLIVGAMKCGTTSFFNYLAEHPQVCPCEPKKEPNFFASDDNYAKGLEWYRSLWNYNPSVHKVALEGSTSYTKMKTPEVVERILETRDRTNVHFRFIYIVRDPIERVESHYTHALTTKWGKNMMRLEQGIDRKLIKISRYAEQIDAYYKKFPDKDILLLNFSDIKQDPSGTLQKTCQFLNLDTSFDFQNVSRNYHPTKGKVINSRIWPFVKPFSELLPDGKSEALRKKLGHTIEGNIRLSSAQRSLVLDELRDDLKKLETAYNVDISRWKVGR